MSNGSGCKLFQNVNYDTVTEMNSAFKFIYV